MKKLIVFFGVILLTANLVSAQKKVTISKTVVATADQVKMDYKSTVKKASEKDSKAISELLEFSRLVDGAEATEHAVTCLELITRSGDWAMAKAIESRKATLKKALLKRFTEAQKSTQYAELKKPIKSWAPYTWEALNNRQVVKASAQVSTDATPDMAKGAGSLQGAQQGQEQSGTGVTAPKRDGSRGN
ncbi:MAG: hypothetical protein EP344_15800 [Bacteroidetes bacterium]|nr:MAG: hypothetical protein EP344_15800 [Bacteroidota bacterium]